MAKQKYNTQKEVSVKLSKETYAKFSEIKKSLGLESDAETLRYMLNKVMRGDFRD